MSQPSHDQQPVPQEAQALSFDQQTDRDIRRLYARLRPDQRTAIGGEFIRLFRLSGDPEAQRFVRPMDGMLSSAQVAEMHVFARDHLPRVLEEVRKHPVTQDALAHPGEEVEEVETEEVIIQDPVMGGDQETAAETGGLTSGYFMAEEGANRADSLFAQPDHPAHTSEGGADILEDAQREGPPTNPADHGG